MKCNKYLTSALLILSLFSAIPCSFAYMPRKQPAQLTDLSATNVIFVEQTRGLDSLDGMSPTRPKKTISAAMAIANGGDTVRVLDSAVYTESLTVPASVTLMAPNATVAGEIVMGEMSRVYLDRHVATANDQTLLTKTGIGAGYYTVSNSFYDGFSGVVNIENDTSSSILFAKVTYMRVSGVGIRDLAPMSGSGGHVHFSIMDMYLEADNAIGLDASNDEGDLIGRIDHIKFRAPATTGLKGISVSNGAVVEAVIGDIQLPGNTAYEVVGSGLLYLNCIKISGTQTGNAVLNLSTNTGYTRAQVDQIAADTLANAISGRQLYYCGTDTVTVGAIDYGLFQTTPLAASTITATAEIIGAVSTQYAGAPGGITPELGITTLPAGSAQITLFVRNNQVGGRNVALQVRMSRVDSAGAFIDSIATGAATIAAPGALVTQRIPVDVAHGAISMDSTDKILISLWHARTGTLTGANPTLTYYSGGETSCVLSFGVPGDVLMLTDASNASNPVFDNASFTGDIQGTRIGLGLTPGYRLHLRGSEGDVQHRLDTAGYTGINIRPNSGKSGWLSFTEDSVGDRWVTGIAAGDSKLYWRSGSEASNVERMSLDVNGYLVLATETIALDPGAVVTRGYVGVNFVSSGTYDTGLLGKMNTDGSNSTTLVTFDNASFTGNISVVGVASISQIETTKINDVYVIDQTEKDTIASITLNLGSYSNTVSSGSTSLATDKKFTHGILFLGGLTYDLANDPNVTLNQTGATTVIELSVPVVGDRNYIVLILK